MVKQTFKEFLVELQVSDDPAQALKDVKQAARMGEDKYRKQQMAKNVEAQRDIQKDADDPLKLDKLRLAKMKQQAAAQAKRLSQKEKRAARQAGVAPEERGTI